MMQTDFMLIPRRRAKGDDAQGARQHSPRSTVRRDLACVAASTMLVGAACAHAGFDERMYQIVIGIEQVWLGGTSAVLVMFSIGCAWFAWRRYSETRFETLLRRKHKEIDERLLAEQRSLLKQVLSAQESERQRLARQLHDEIDQYLTGISVDAARIRHLSDGRDAEMHHLSSGILRSATHVSHEIGAMIGRLRPVGLDELGLRAALEHVIESWRGARLHSSVTFAITGTVDDLDERLSITIFRFVQEGLVNASTLGSHARLELMVARTIDSASDVVDVFVSMIDENPGADPCHFDAGMNFISMREQVKAAGGEFYTLSPESGGLLTFARLPVRW